MKTVFKYTLHSTEGTVQLPVGAKILLAGVQDTGIQLWAEVESTAPLISRQFFVVGTGHEMPTGRLEYISTVFVGMLVWHIYEQLSD
jgi:hypothetical protein